MDRSEELKIVLAELRSQPTSEVVKFAECLANECSTAFVSVAEVILVATIKAEMCLNDGLYARVDCDRQSECIAVMMVSKWFDRPAGKPLHLGQSLRVGVASRVEALKSFSSTCSCSHSYKSVMKGLEEVEQANLEAARNLGLEELKTFGGAWTEIAAGR